MRRTITKFGSVAAVSMFALALAQPAEAVQQPTTATTSSSAYFEFTDGTDTFVFKLTDSAKIQQARNILSGVETENVGVMGKVVKTPAFYNSPWKYQIAPNSVSFFGMAMEVCDASIAYVDEHLNEVGGALLPASTWCPWQSKLTREITAP
ncbi:hypothetical protein KCMC57_up07060 [Kitasatospora sp. CMC57]|uniref:BP74 N-terminal domain-containing protein n=1 Tax=Kitasatospora sp. CMC57 TaxID=3231513 RepID=A0AB33JM22_9ACTN